MRTLYTIGHSNHTLEEFINLLEIYDINQLIDIRTVPKARRLPWFNKEALKAALHLIGIKYHHLPKLGGFRKAKKDSLNTGWHNLSFRGFADYMLTMDFFAGLKELNDFVKRNGKTAIMCAEALPFRCHRSLISDAEIARGVKVLHIMNPNDAKEHELTSFAIIDKASRPIKIFYPASAQIEMPELR